MLIISLINHRLKPATSLAHNTRRFLSVVGIPSANSDLKINKTFPHNVWQAGRLERAGQRQRTYKPPLT